MRNEDQEILKSRLSLPEWEYLPDGWETKDPHIKGWNVVSVGVAQLQKWKRFIELVEEKGPLGIAHESPVPIHTSDPLYIPIKIFERVLRLICSGKNSVSVLDWGSGAGHYYVIARKLFPEVRFEYTCKDVPVLCLVGKSVLPEVPFVSEDSCLERKYDLIWASGSLQYSRDWKTVSKRLAQASNPYLCITRFPVVKSFPSHVLLQRTYAYGYETEYMGWALNRDEFLFHMDSCGMKLVEETALNESLLANGAPERCEFKAFLFSKR